MMQGCNYIVYVSKAALKANYIHYSLMGKIRLPFVDSDLLYRGGL
jgi:hypothetical protein